MNEHKESTWRHRCLFLSRAHDGLSKSKERESSPAFCAKHELLVPAITTPSEVDAEPFPGIAPFAEVSVTSARPKAGQ